MKDEINKASQQALDFARDLSDLAGRLERNRPEKLDDLDAPANFGLLAESAIAVQKWLIAVLHSQMRLERLERLEREAKSND